MARFLRQALGRRSLYVFLDQAAVSAGTFLTGWLAARNLKPTALMGNYHLFMQVAFYVYSLQQAMVVFPLTIKGAPQTKGELSRTTGAALAHTLLLGPVLMLIVGVSAAVQGKSLSLALLVGLAVMAWLFQETVRRALLAHLEHHRAIAGDALRSAIQAGGVLALVSLGRLSLEGIFIAIAAGGLIAGIVQAVQLRLRWPMVREIIQNARDFWRLGRWMLASAALGVVTTLAFPYSLLGFHGESQVAILGAFGSILVFVSPLTQSIVGLILPVSARAMASGGMRAAAIAAAKGGLMGAAILLPILLMLFLFPQASARLLLKQPEYLAEYWALRWCVIAQAVMFLGAVIEAFLNSLQESHSNFLAYVISAGAVLVIGIPLTWYDGVRGALLGGIICVLVKVLATIYFVRRLHWGGEPLAEGEAGRVQTALNIAGQQPVMGVE